MSIQYPTVPLVTPSGSSYNDTGSVYGAGAITFTSGGSQTCDCTDFAPEYPSTKKVQKDKNGVPVRQFALPEVPTCTLNMIVASNSTQLPAPGWVFTCTQTGTMSWYVDKSGTPFKQEDFLIVPISASQKIN